jgi:hypothetical protein
LNFSTYTSVEELDRPPTKYNQERSTHCATHERERDHPGAGLADCMEQFLDQVLHGDDDHSGKDTHHSRDHDPRLGLLHGRTHGLIMTRCDRSRPANVGHEARPRSRQAGAMIRVGR